MQLHEACNGTLIFNFEASLGGIGIIPFGSANKFFETFPFYSLFSIYSKRMALTGEILVMIYDGTNNIKTHSIIVPTLSNNT